MAVAYPYGAEKNRHAGQGDENRQAERLRMEVLCPWQRVNEPCRRNIDQVLRSDGQDQACADGEQKGAYLFSAHRRRKILDCRLNVAAGPLRGPVLAASLE